ncbi:uncharacterized protein [Hoplias malabaricus]|uniref:uncharacterized protein isoform X2 n=1 Tax=Hoplias malabaricus TaxID=27720 RepID=UPI00346301A0
MFPFTGSDGTQTNRRRHALGPFPRSTWIHPLAPEDDLDKVCFSIWKRSVWAARYVWQPHEEKAHRSADDTLAPEIKTNDDSTGRVNVQHEMDEVIVMVQREKAQALQQMYDSVIPFHTAAADCRSLGDDPDNPKEIISTEEVERRKIERFLKDALFANRDKAKAEVSDGPSLEDFPPLPGAASPWGHRLAQKAPIRNKVSSDISPSRHESQTFDDPTPPKPQRETKHQKCQKLKPVVSTKSARMEEVQTAQASKAHNEPCSQLSRSCQTGDVTEAANVSTGGAAVDGGQMSKKQGRSILPVFATFRAGGKPTTENLPITGRDGLQGEGADGARVARDPTGTDTASVRKTAGTTLNARSHLYQEHTTALWRKTLGSASDKGVPVGHMAGLQAQDCQYHKAEGVSSSRYTPQKAPFPEHCGPAPAPALPFSTYPAPLTPVRCPPGFPYPQITPESVAVACLLLSCGVLVPGCVGVPVLPFQPFHLFGDSHCQRLPLFNSDNFPDNVNPQGASRECFMHTPNGSTAAGNTGSSRCPL